MGLLKFSGWIMLMPPTVIAEVAPMALRPSPRCPQRSLPAAAGHIANPTKMLTADIAPAAARGLGPLSRARGHTLSTPPPTTAAPKGRIARSVRLRRRASLPKLRGPHAAAARVPPAVAVRRNAPWGASATSLPIDVPPLQGATP